MVVFLISIFSAFLFFVILYLVVKAAIVAALRQYDLPTLMRESLSVLRQKEQPVEPLRTSAEYVPVAGRDE